MKSGVHDTEVAQALVELEELGENHFRNCYNQDSQVGMMFGGQLLAQGLAAAQKTVASWRVHNCNAYFPSAGSSREPVEYYVEVVRNGSRYANRRVTGMQGSKVILDMLCAFTAEGPGLEHQLTQPPAVPRPEDLLAESEFVRSNSEQLPEIAVTALSLPFPVEIRVVDAEKMYLEGSLQTSRNYWFRMPSAARLSTPAEHNCMLAFLADYRLGGVALAPHLSPVEIERMIVMTLNHSMWFHQSANAHEWLLYTTDTPWAGHGRGLARGAIYNQKGELIITAVQELMVGVRDPS